MSNREYCANSRSRLSRDLPGPRAEVRSSAEPWTRTRGTSNGTVDRRLQRVHRPRRWILPIATSPLRRIRRRGRTPRGPKLAVWRATRPSARPAGRGQGQGRGPPSTPLISGPWDAGAGPPPAGPVEIRHGRRRRGRTRGRRVGGVVFDILARARGGAQDGLVAVLVAGAMRRGDSELRAAQGLARGRGAPTMVARARVVLYRALRAPGATGRTRVQARSRVSSVFGVRVGEAAERDLRAPRMFGADRRARGRLHVTASSAPKPCRGLGDQRVAVRAA